MGFIFGILFFFAFIVTFYYIFFLGVSTSIQRSFQQTPVENTVPIDKFNKKLTPVAEEVNLSTEKVRRLAGNAWNKATISKIVPKLLKQPLKLGENVYKLPTNISVKISNQFSVSEFENISPHVDTFVAFTNNIDLVPKSAEGKFIEQFTFESSSSEINRKRNGAVYISNQKLQLPANIFKNANTFIILNRENETGNVVFILLYSINNMEALNIELSNYELNSLKTYDVCVVAKGSNNKIESYFNKKGYTKVDQNFLYKQITSAKHL